MTNARAYKHGASSTICTKHANFHVCLTTNLILCFANGQIIQDTVVDNKLPPGAAAWRIPTKQRHLSFCPLAQLCETWCHLHKTGNRCTGTWRIALSSQDDRATATFNMYITFREVWTCGFENTNRQTNKLIAILPGTNYKLRNTPLAD